MTTSVPNSRLTPNGASQWTIAIFALMGLGLGLVVFAFIGPTYEAQTLVAVSNPAAALSEEVEVVLSPAVLDVAATLLGFEPQISVTSAEVAGLLTITASNDDPQRAAAAANVVAETYVQAQQGAAANVAQPAEAPNSPSGLGPLVFAAIGTTVGAAIGLIAGPFQRRRAARMSSGPAQPVGQSQPDIRPGPPPVLLRDRRNDPGRSPSPSHQAPNAMPAADSLSPQQQQPLEDKATQDKATQVEATQVEATQVEATQGKHSEDKPTQDKATEGKHSEDKAAAPLPALPRPAPQTFGRANMPAVPHQNPTAATDAAAAAVVVVPQHQPPDPAPQPSQPEPADQMKPPSRSFSDAASGINSNPPEEPSWMQSPTVDPALDRRAHESQLETTRYELTLAHSEELARLSGEHKRQITALQAEVARLTKQLRVQGARLKNRSGENQTRTGDLEAQVDALEIELAGLRDILERERISHTKKLTEERGVADRALDNSRREYREELAKHLHAHRHAFAEHRADLDRELAADRTRHAEALDQQHRDYEAQLGVERKRAEAKLLTANERHERELATVRTAARTELDRQSAQHKTTIETLRGSGEGAESRMLDIEKENRLLRAEFATLQKQARHNDTEHNDALQRATDDLALNKTELDAERQRNSALRADVLRRSAESHQVIDRAVEERTAQLAELEASVTKQRQYADNRVREISAASDEQARQAATREAGLTATISRLKRELAELTKAQSPNKP